MQTATARGVVRQEYMFGGPRIKPAAIPRPDRAAPEIGITVEKAEVVPSAASPTLAFKLRLCNVNSDQTVHSMVLRCQILAEVSSRRESRSGEERFCDLVGDPEPWGQTLRKLPWTNINVVVPQFTGVTTVDVEVPCTFAFSVAITKHFSNRAGKGIPVCVIFSGTSFYADPAGALRIAPIAWDSEAKFCLPHNVWKEMMDAYYPKWLNFRRGVLDQLGHQHTTRRAIPVRPFYGLVHETHFSAARL